MISSHSDNDDMRHYEYARRYPYPIHTARRRISADAWIVIVCAVIGTM
jgi:hypothetical protein